MVLDQNLINKTVLQIMEDHFDDIDEDFEADSVQIQGTLSGSDLTLQVALPAELHSEELMLTIFYDLFYEVEVPEDTYYRFHWRTPTDQYVLETSVSKMPGTGLLEEDDWSGFTDQLIYSRNGQPLDLPSP